MKPYSGPTSAPFAPDAEQILGQLMFWFGDQLTGEIDIGWVDPQSGNLNRFRRFDVGDIDECAAFIAEVNAVPGQSVYFRPALVQPDAPRHVRDEHFLGAAGAWVDLDAEGAADAAPNIYSLCRPNMVVVTGWHPHKRAQLFWRLEEPVNDPGLLRDWNRRIAARLGGDTTVVNPTTLMRVAGTIAWPWKTGRIAERTQLILFRDGRPASYPAGAMMHAFPPAPPSTRGETVEQGDAASAKPGLKIGSEFDGVSVEDCLTAIRDGDHWHDNLVRLTGHWIARGWSDAEILTAAEGLMLKDYSVEQTRHDMAKMITGGRAKWNIPNPEHEVDDAPAAVPLAPAFIDDLNIALLPRRRWLLGRALLRGKLTVKVAPPGVGKSTLGLARAVAVVTGQPITGEAVHEPTKVWVYNNEDDSDELKRRLAAVLQHWNIPLEAIRGRLALNSGADRPLLVARADRAGTVIRLPDVDACIAHIRDHGIGLFIVDPFVETHEVNENSNEQIKAVAAMFRAIAHRGECAVMLVHHTAKPPQGTSDGHAGNLNTARGASALPGIARVVQTLFSMSERDAAQYGVSEEDRRLYVRLDDAKANLGLISGEAFWFRRVSVTIANGDEVGVLVPEDLEVAGEDDGADDLHRTIIACLLARTSDPEITLNAAARLLAWSGDERFSRYRETDKSGNQRASRPLRDAILEACRRHICIVSSGRSQGFTCDQRGRPLMLKHFDVPASPADIASQEPEFMEES
jgi:hypothetical protein